MTSPYQVWRLSADGTRWYCGSREIIIGAPVNKQMRLFRARQSHTGSDTPVGPYDPRTFKVVKTGSKTANVGLLTNKDALPALNATNATDFVPTSNTTYENCVIYGRIKPAASATNITFRNVWFKGPAVSRSSNGSGAICDFRAASLSNMLVEDCLFMPTNPDLNTNSLIGHHYTVRRCEAMYMTDFAGCYNTNSGQQNSVAVKIYNNYAHDFAYWYPDVDHSDGTHNDFVQLHGGRDIEIIGNLAEWNYNPAVSSGITSNPVYPDTAWGNGILVQTAGTLASYPTRNVKIVNNEMWGSGGSITLRELGVPGDPVVSEMRGNILNRSGHNYGNSSYYLFRFTSGVIIEDMASLSGKSSAEIIEAYRPYVQRNFWNTDSTVTAALRGQPLDVGRDLGCRIDGVTP